MGPVELSLSCAVDELGSRGLAETTRLRSQPRVGPPRKIVPHGTDRSASNGGGYPIIRAVQAIGPVLAMDDTHRSGELRPLSSRKE